MSSSFCVQLRWEVIVRFVDTGGMDDHHCLSFLFIIYPQIDISRQSHTFPLRCSHINYVRFVFISSWLLEGSCLIYVIYVWFGIVVCNTYCDFVLFVFVLCTLCCQFLWIVHFWLLLRYSLTFICFVCLRLCCQFLWIVHLCMHIVKPCAYFKRGNVIPFQNGLTTNLERIHFSNIHIYIRKKCIFLRICQLCW